MPGLFDPIDWGSESEYGDEPVHEPVNVASANTSFNVVLALDAQSERFKTAQELHREHLKTICSENSKTMQTEMEAKMLKVIRIACFATTIAFVVLAFSLYTMSVKVVVPVTTTCPSRHCPVVTCRCPEVTCRFNVTVPVTGAPFVKPVNESFFNATLETYAVTEPVTEVSFVNPLEKSFINATSQTCPVPEAVTETTTSNEFETEEESVVTTTVAVAAVFVMNAITLSVIVLSAPVGMVFMVGWA